MHHGSQQSFVAHRNYAAGLIIQNPKVLRSMSSFCTKSYRYLTCLTLIHHLQRYMPHSCTISPQIVYRESKSKSKSLILCLAKGTTQTWLLPNFWEKPDSDLIQQIISVIKHVTIIRHHVHGHQDKNIQITHLYFLAQHNILAQPKATAMQKLMTGPVKQVHSFLAHPTMVRLD